VDEGVDDAVGAWDALVVREELTLAEVDCVGDVVGLELNDTLAAQVCLIARRRMPRYGDSGDHVTPESRLERLA
jgi:hypothetical protein